MCLPFRDATRADTRGVESGGRPGGVRAAGCFVVITRIANTEIPFPATTRTPARQSWEAMKEEARKLLELFDHG